MRRNVPDLAVARSKDRMDMLKSRPFVVFSVRTSVCRELPLELEGRADEEELEVSVEEMKDEMYVPKKKTFLPFSGRGYRLGR